MGKRIDLTGQKFHRWEVLEFSRRSGSHYLWACRCTCGAIKDVSGMNLKSGQSKSCGCLSREMSRSRRTHGHAGSKSPTYLVWANLKSRCSNPNVPDYSNYGGRGIGYCERWKSFEAFLEDMGEQPKGRTLDRIDNNLGYSKDNCRWATMKQQAENRRTTLSIPDGDERVTLVEYARRRGLCVPTARRLLIKAGIIHSISTSTE